MTKVWFWAWLILAMSFLSLYEAQTDIRMPPSITLGPPTDVLFQPGDRVSMICEAEGSAQLSYTWRKNGANIDCSSKYECTRGKISAILQADINDEGKYQCFVSNAYGATMTNVMNLRMYQQGNANTAITYQTPPINGGLQLQCNAPATVPSYAERAQNADSAYPITNWGRATNSEDAQPVDITTTARVQIDSVTGDLYFANMETLDSTFYKCRTLVLSGQVYTGFNNVTVQGVNSANFPPRRMIATMIPSIGLEGNSVVFQCFFEGRPTPVFTSAQWKKVGGSLTLSRTNFSDSYTKMKISHLQPSDEGTYTCEPQGYANLAESFILNIQAAPRFESELDMPHNLNASDQDVVTINCSAYANPAASVTWYRNGEVLNNANMPPKFSLSPDLTQLTITNVCKDCGGGASDLMSIQCNASNVHGYSFVQGYLNVLQRTEIQSQTINRPANQELYVMPCLATTDDSTTLDISWYHDNFLVQTDAIVTISADNTLSVDMRNLTENEFTRYCGSYSCQATNGFSTDVITSTIICDAPIVQSSNSWIIGLVVALVIILLIILLLLLYFCCIKDNEGDTYLVDEKEKQNGNDPVQELRDEDFKDFKRDGETPYSTMNLGMSMATTMESPVRGMDYQYPSGNEMVTFAQSEPVPAYEPYAFNSQHVQNNNSSVMYSAENGGQISFNDVNQVDGSRSVNSVNRPGSRPFTPLAYTTQPDQIQLIEQGVPFGTFGAPQRPLARDSGSQYGGSVRHEPQLFDVNFDDGHGIQQQQQHQQQQQQQRQQYQDQYRAGFDDGFQGYDQGQGGYNDNNGSLPYGMAPNDGGLAQGYQNGRQGAYQDGHQGAYQDGYQGAYQDGHQGDYNVHNQRVEYDESSDSSSDDDNYLQERPVVATGWAALNMQNNPTSDV